MGDAARFGIANFRVITVTPTTQRALDLCEKMRKAGLASKRFWFTDLTQVSADEPAKILEPIFLAPKDFEERVFCSFRD